MTISKSRLKHISPIHKVVFSFLLLIFSGTFILMLPGSTISGISFIDALFTSTSSVCVTGLIVLDTAKDFTLPGQIVILCLIQLGGLGIMTVSIALLSFMGNSLSIKWRFTFRSIYDNVNPLPVRGTLRNILLYTFSIEIITAILLFSRFIREFSFKEAVRHSVFHAVSAFCNAGFSTFSNNLEGYRNDASVLLTVSFAVILGGLGFIVLSELFTLRSRGFKGFFRGFSLHTKLVLITTAILLAAGTISIFILEQGHAFKDFTVGSRLLTSFFHSVTCRTAGFNTINISSLRESTLFTMIALMFVGGSPGSIAGGIKTTTLAAIFGLVYARITGHHQVVFRGRALDRDTVDRSTTLIIMSGLFIYLSTFLLLFLHSFDIDHTFLSGLFEITSAFSTVGLSTGVTSTLSNEGKALISLVMFTGRLGPLLLITALNVNRKDINYQYAEDSIMIG